MQISENKVVTFHYELSDEVGQTIDSSREGEPLPYLHGHRNIVPGLENAMAGRQKGDSFKVKVQPQLAYGLRDEDKVFFVPRQDFAGIEELEVGAMCQLKDPNGEEMLVTVTDIQEEQVEVDANHPFAGHVLNFDVEIVDVRDATDAEIEAGAIAL